MSEKSVTTLDCLILVRILVSNKGVQLNNSCAAQLTATSGSSRALVRLRHEQTQEKSKPGKFEIAQFSTCDFFKIVVAIFLQKSPRPNPGNFSFTLSHFHS